MRTEGRKSIGEQEGRNSIGEKQFFFFLIDIEHKLHSNEILMNDRMRTVICTAYVKHRACMGSGAT